MFICFLHTECSKEQKTVSAHLLPSVSQFRKLWELVTEVVGLHFLSSDSPGMFGSELSASVTGTNQTSADADGESEALKLKHDQQVSVWHHCTFSPSVWRYLFRCVLPQVGAVKVSIDHKSKISRSVSLKLLTAFFVWHWGEVIQDQRKAEGPTCDRAPTPSLNTVRPVVHVSDLDSCSYM